MAHLRGDSTVGGKPIVTLDEMNEFVEQIQGVGLKAKINKYEATSLKNLIDADTICASREMNGIWTIEDTEEYQGMYPQGQLVSLSNSFSKFQMYAPEKETNSNKSVLYFRTGRGSNVNDWEKVATKTMLDDGLKNKVNSLNGSATNLKVNSQLNINDSIYLGDINLLTEGFFLGDTFDPVNSPGILPDGKFGIYLRTGADFGIKIGQSSATLNGKTIYHEGNLDLTKYIEKQPKILIPGSDVLVLTGTGYYVCNDPSGVPSGVKGLTYIEVINYANGVHILQKIYTSDGKYAYYRACFNNTWTSWTSLVGPLTYTRNITAANWSKGTDTYELTVTHGLGSENITSVIVTDENKISMFTGFQVISSTVVKVFSATNPAGKIVINAIQ